MPNTLSDDEIREDIKRRAAAHAEATVYSLNNPYLTKDQKARVEAVFQFPFGIFAYAFAAAALVANQSFWMAYLIATGVSAVAWTMARFLPGRLFYPVSLVFAGSGLTIISLLLAVWAFFEQRWGVGAFLGLSAFGIASMVEAPMWLWTVTAGRMNAKYGIAKRNFGMSFPFEAELD